MMDSDSFPFVQEPDRRLAKSPHKEKELKSRTRKRAGKPYSEILKVSGRIVASSQMFFFERENLRVREAISCRSRESHPRRYARPRVLHRCPCGPEENACLVPR